MKSPQDCRQVHFSVLKIQIYCKVVTCGCLYLPSLSHCHLFSAHNMFCFSYVYSHVSFWAIQKCVCRKISNIEKRPLFLICDSDDNTKSCLWPTQFNLPEPCNKSTTAELSHCWHMWLHSHVLPHCTNGLGSQSFTCSYFTHCYHFFLCFVFLNYL